MDKTIRRTVRVLAVIGLGAAGLLLSCPGCGPEAEEPEASVLLVVVDTLRADRLGCMGSDLGLTPAMDAFAKEGVLFRNAYSHAPWTLPSFASMLTSTFPAQHGAGGRLGGFFRLKDSAQTLGECFRSAGAKTAAVVNVDFLTSAFGMDSGFDELDFVKNRGNHLTRIAVQTTDAALGWLDRMKEAPFFLMVHYFDPHLIYEPPREYRRLFALEQDRETDDPVFGSLQEITQYRYGGLRLEEERIRRLEGLHNGEVAYTDAELARLLGGLAERGLDESTIVVITSDHGEEFFDHGGFEHGHSLYDELLHIPLMIRWPGRVPAGKVVESTVRHIDLAPTLCGLAGVEPGARFEGDDLAPLWTRNGPHPDRPVFSEGNFWGELRFSRRADGYLVIAHQENRRIEVYDLANDPALKTDLSQSDPELRQRLFSDLMLSRRGMVIDPGKPMPADLTKEQRERLKKLGY